MYKQGLWVAGIMYVVVCLGGMQVGRAQESSGSRIHRVTGLDEALKDEAILGSEAQGWVVKRPGKEQLRRLEASSHPVIVANSWSSAGPGGEVEYRVSIFNPGTEAVNDLYVRVWIGASAPVTDQDAAIQVIDRRFDELVAPEAFGLTLNPSEVATIAFTIKIPQGITPSVYIGNSLLFMGNYFGACTPLSRVFFPFRVTP